MPNGAVNSIMSLFGGGGGPPGFIDAGGEEDPQLMYMLKMAKTERERQAIMAMIQAAKAQRMAKAWQERQAGMRAQQAMAPGSTSTRPLDTIEERLANATAAGKLKDFYANWPNRAAERMGPKYEGGGGGGGGGGDFGGGGGDESEDTGGGGAGEDSELQDVTEPGNPEAPPTDTFSSGGDYFASPPSGGPPVGATGQTAESGGGGGASLSNYGSSYSAPPTPSALGGQSIDPRVAAIMELLKRGKRYGSDYGSAYSRPEGWRY